MTDTANGIRKDPKVRADGLCAVCKGERKVPENRQKGVSISVYTEDPFCSATCARTYHNNPIGTFSSTAIS